MRPFTDSRSERGLVEAGSMAYSAVTQPSPDPLRQRGTPSAAEAAQSTRVLPNSTSTEPAAWSSQWRGVGEPVAGDRHRSELVVGPSVSTRHTQDTRWGQPGECPHPSGWVRGDR